MHCTDIYIVEIPYTTKHSRGKTFVVFADFTLKLFLLHYSFILLCAHSKIHIAEAHVGFKAANHESLPYIMHIVDEP